MSAGQESSKKVTRRHLAEWSWYVASLVYCGVRIFLADRYLRDYGVNVAVFAVIEFGSTIPYAFGTARAVGALADREPRRAVPWALLATAGFLAPDCYTLLTADAAPVGVIAVIVVWIVAAGSFALYRVAGMVRERRAERRPARQDVGSSQT